MQSKLVNCLLILIVLAGLFFLPWKKIDWGKFQLTSLQTITVTGQAETQEKNQIANFSAGVTILNENKKTATNEVNQKMDLLIKTVKDFGIESLDIKTQRLSVYEDKKTNQWRVNNSINITLREIDKASALADLLTNSGATEVSGPNFRMDETNQWEKTLLEKAIADAKDKAEAMAKASNGKLGKVVSISESGSQSYPLYRTAMESAAPGASLEPGSSTVSKSVTVVFELEN